MAVFGKRVDAPGGERRSARQPVVLAASALGLTCTTSVVVPDLSSTGARLQGRNLPPPGERLLINFGESSLLARVAWSGADECGIVFDGPLTDQDVKDLQCEADWGRAMGLA